jgi:molybdopterin/thiamine biosynthesis adenylyltransferase
MTRDIEAELRGHLLRTDGQEDVCIATYSPSTGARRTSRIIRAVELPQDGERRIHGDASFTGEYVLRVAAMAAARGQGIAIAHSHPGGSGWQGLSTYDHDAERSYALLAARITGLPLVGMTLAGVGGALSARVWYDKQPTWCESVRVVGTSIKVHWNDGLVPVAQFGPSQHRTISAWGPKVHADLTRMRILVVGVGSVGLDVAQRLAATGIRHVAVMDPDVVKRVNLDRMVGATRADARRGRKKVLVARRLLRSASTASPFTVEAIDDSVCTPHGLLAALDFDVVFSCVDRPWPRAILNTLAYSDLIPVIDGGIGIDTFPDGRMRGATWRTHTVLPGRPCMACTGQLSLQEVTLERQGLLDDPEYIRAAGSGSTDGSPNVALLAASVSAAQLAQFVSLIAAPGGRGVPSPLRYALAPHLLQALDFRTQPYWLFAVRGERAC